jgi:hypothetical protein
VTPVVSVVIVSYRSREPLAGCLASLRAAAAAVPLEVIVVDNASGDGTPAWIAAAHPEVRCVANPDNRGFTRGVNQGAALATGEFLFVLNPDCEVGGEALRGLVAAARATPDLAAAAPMLVDGAGRVARSCGRFPNLWTLLCDHLGLAAWFAGSPLFGGYKYGGRPMESLDRVDWASGAALLIPRAVWNSVGGLDEGIFMYMEEVDWCRRAARAGLSVRFQPGARVVHFGQQSSRQVPGETYLHNLRSRVYYFRKHFGAAAAGVAKAILMLSLVLKWAASAASRAGRRVYAAGLGAVWAA